MHFKHLSLAVFTAFFSILGMTATAALPTGFAELEYIETHGNSWLDTGVKAQSGLHIVADLQLLDNRTDGRLFGGSADGDSGADALAVVGGGDQQKISFYHPGATDYAQSYNHSYASSKGLHLRNRYEVIDNVFKINGTAAVTATATAFESTGNVFLGAMGSADGVADRNKAPMKIFRFSITNSSDVALLDWVPAVRESDGAVGVYDLVASTFVANGGTASFIAGPRLDCTFPRATSLMASKTRRATLTVAHYAGSTTLERVPVLVRLSPSRLHGFSYADCQLDGSDVFFTSDAEGYKVLPHEIDTWRTDGESLLWVKIPTLSGRKTRFYVWWGGDTTTGHAPSTEVWSEYIGVWHMNTLDVNNATPDSTGHGWTATVNGSGTVAISASGSVLGGALDTTNFTAGNYDDFMNGFYTKSASSIPDVISVSGWFKSPNYTTTTSWQSLVNKYDMTDDNNRYGYLLQTQKAKLYTSATTYYADKAGNSYIPATTWKDFRTNWNRYDFSTDGYTQRIRVNGTTASELNSGGTITKAVGKSSIPLTWACQDGLLVDEWRVARVVFSSDRRVADYYMMTDADYVVSDGAVAFVESLSVTSASDEYAPDEIAYGVSTDIAHGATVVKSAPAGEQSAANGNKAVCTGWRLYVRGSDGVETQVRSSADTTVAGEDARTCIVTVDGAMRLEWFWSRTAAGVKQGGLLAHWDCRNGLSSSGWTDLVGSRTFTWSNAAKVKATTDGFSLVDSAGWGVLSADDTTQTFSAALNGTVEVVFKNMGTANQFIYETKDKMSMHQWNSSYIQGQTGSGSGISFKNDLGLHTIAMAYTSKIGKPAESFVDGAGATAGGGTSFSATTPAGAYLGRRSYSTYTASYLKGTILAIRVYSSRLSPYEALHNAETDAFHYNPCEIVVESDSDVLGGVLGSGTYAPGETVRVSASAKPGNEFLEWTGDVDGLDVTSPELEFAADSSRNLLAVFKAGEGIEVTAAPSKIGEPVPGYGISTSYQKGTTYQLSMPNPHVAIDESSRYHCRGWVLYNSDNEEIRSSDDPGEQPNQLSITYTAPCRLMWQWEIQSKIALSTTFAGGTVSFDGENWSAAATAWFAKGDAVTVYGGDDATYHYVWSGLPGEAVFGENNRTATFEMGDETLEIVSTRCGILTVVGEPENKQVSGQPLYGEKNAVVGSTVEYTAPSGAISVSSTEQSVVAGYKVNGGALAQSLSYSHTQVANEATTLTWVWTNQYSVALAGPEVSVDGENWVSGLTSAWVTIGDTVTLYAGKDPAKTYVWSGLPEEGVVYGENNRTATFKVTEAIKALGGDSAYQGKIWTGLVNSNWGTANNWFPAGAPTAADDVKLVGKSIYLNTAIAVKDLILDDTTLTVSRYGIDNEIVVSGKLVLTNGSTITQYCSKKGVDYKYAVNLLVNGVEGVFVDETSKIDTTALGNPAADSSVGLDPGRASGNYIGASYAGRGAAKSETFTTPYCSRGAYGSIREPHALGSPGFWSGSEAGGIVKIVVPNGDITLEGAITCRSSSTSGSGAGRGSGGSIWLSSKRLLGSGTLDVRSGTETYGGSAGRIAIYQTAASETNGLIRINAGATSNNGCNGTVYIENAGDSGQGELVIDAQNTLTVASVENKSGTSVNTEPFYAARIGDNVTGYDTPFKKITVKNKGRLAVEEGKTITCSELDDTVIATGTIYANTVDAKGNPVAAKSGKTYTCEGYGTIVIISSVALEITCDTTRQSYSLFTNSVVFTGQTVASNAVVTVVATPVTGYEYASVPDGWSAGSVAGTITRDFTCSNNPTVMTIPDATLIVKDIPQVDIGGGKKITVKVDGKFLAKIDPTGTKTPEQVSAELTTKGANGINKIDSYILGLDPNVKTSQPIVTSTQNAKTDMLTISMGNIAIKTGAGAKPKFMPLTADTPTTAMKPVEGASESESSSFEVSVPTDTNPVKYYKIGWRLVE